MSSSEIYDTDSIAVVGMSGRFPGANNVADFWRNLAQGIESISFFSREELEGVDPAFMSHPAFVNAGGVIDGIEMFDASFFGYNPREAEVLDPQQRLFMECAWEALETAGYDAERFEGAIGVYAGTAISTYLFNILANREVLATVGSFQVLISNDKDHLTTHVSYKLNLKGPSVTVQTACSTSLVAICMACQSLLDQQCDIALAGGVGLKVPQKTGYLYQEGMINSPDGHCRTFDAKAKGTVGGSGVGVVALRRLADAVADGDNILAIVKGFAINNDGSLKVGYTAPSVEGQSEVIAMAQSMAGVEPETITYIEAHGTATPLGDPIEIAALTRAFRAGTDKKNFCAIASVKSNIGHLDPAAGVAGFIKTVLMLKHKLIPPSLHFERPNPKIDFARSPFYVSTQLSEWKRYATPRRAGVSSFGIGGTNAHVVLEEPPETGISDPSRSAQLLLLSAKTDTALKAAVSNLADHLRRNPNENLPDVAYTCQVGRRRFDYRAMTVCRNSSEAIDALSSFDSRVMTARGASNKPVVFMFPGQGAQHVNMASELYETEPGFRAQVDRCADLLRPLLNDDVRKILFPDEASVAHAAQQLERTSFTQPALFVIEYALARLWMEWGVKPAAMVGHSIGEYVAACVAGVFSLEDALSLVCARGRLMDQMPTGAMLSIPLPETEVRTFLNGNLDLAAINAPSSCVVSGPIDAITELEGQLRGKDQNSFRLHTSHAFHSRMMDPVIEPFIELIGKVALNKPQIPYLSNLTGTWVKAEECTDPNYWARHMRHTVRFADGLERLLTGSKSILLEVGPGETLCGLVRQHPDTNSGHVVLSSLRRAQTKQSDVAGLLVALGRLWLNGIEVDWSGFYAHERRRRVELPTYPFERQRYWIDAQPSAQPVPEKDALTLKRPDISDWFYKPAWKRATSQAAAVGTPSTSRWLIFDNELGIGAQLSERLKKTGAEVSVVIRGEQFKMLNAHEYVLNPQASGDYDILFKNLNAQNRLPDEIIYLCEVTPNDQQADFFVLLWLAQALAGENSTRQFQLGVVTNGLYRVNGKELLQPEQATASGPCKVIPQEFPNISCKQVDIALSGTSGVDDQLLIQLLAEFEKVAAHEENVVALRDGERWIQAFEPVKLDHDARSAGLKHGGVYIITGGLGGIGLALAEYISQKVRARLVLIGRSVFPERHEWDQWLSDHDDNNSLSKKIRQVRVLESNGAEVTVVCADVARADEMLEVVKRTRERFGEINGVIHAAGIAGGGMIQLKTAETVNSVFAAKVQGTMALAAALKDVDLDFFVLCSSLTAILGGFGQVDYCGANAFVDAFAHAASSDSRRVISINWDTWQEVGMAVNTALPPDLEKWRVESLKHGILPEEGKEIFGRILRTALPQVLVSTIDFQVRQQNYRSPASTTAEASTRSTISQPAHKRPSLSTSYVAPGNQVEQVIVDIWQELLGTEPIGIYDNFFELGGHSLLAIQLAARLQSALQVELPMRTIFDAPTINELAQRVATAGKGSDDEAKDISEILDMVETLSETEIDALLAGEENVKSQHG